MFYLFIKLFLNFNLQAARGFLQPRFLKTRPGGVGDFFGFCIFGCLQQYNRSVLPLDSCWVLCSFLRLTSW